MNDYEIIEHTKETYRRGLPKPKSALPSGALAQDGWPPKVQRVLAFIIAHLFDPRLTVGWMKQQCRVNGHNFASRFTYYVGETPKKYILHHRVAVAKELMVHPRLEKLTITVVAYEVGFRSLSAFDMAFKSHVGCAPSTFRQLHGNA